MNGCRKLACQRCMDCTGLSRSPQFSKCTDKLRWKVSALIVLNGATRATFPTRTRLKIGPCSDSYKAPTRGQRCGSGDLIEAMYFRPVRTAAGACVNFFSNDCHMPLRYHDKYRLTNKFDPNLLGLYATFCLSTHTGSQPGETIETVCETAHLST